MKPLKEVSNEELNKEMDSIKEKVEKECKWLHQNRRWKALLNEKVRRSGLNIK